jgi:hypothetical protein
MLHLVRVSCSLGPRQSQLNRQALHSEFHSSIDTVLEYIPSGSDHMRRPSRYPPSSLYDLRHSYVVLLLCHERIGVVHCTAQCQSSNSYRNWRFGLHCPPAWFSRRPLPSNLNVTHRLVGTAIAADDAVSQYQRLDLSIGRLDSPAAPITP